MIQIAMTGITGNMGREALRQVLELSDVKVRAAVLGNTHKDKQLARRFKRAFGERLELVWGSIDSEEVCKQLVQGADYLIHMAAVIPPKSDWQPEASRRCNLLGTRQLIAAVEAMPRQAKFVHISTVALYGNRNEKHPWGRVGDPLLPSPYDHYALHKMQGERSVLESALDTWVVLRQSAMLHPNMLKDNISDGLMFHTPFNAPLEWVSARDSGYLIKRLIERDLAGELEGFWKRIYNIGAPAENRATGYDTFKDGFAIIGGSAEKFMKPHWNAVRNFHGVWFYDAGELQRWFGYQRDTTRSYWQDIAAAHKIYGVARIIPPTLIRALVFYPLLGNGNSPRKWAKRGEEGKVKAYFGCRENFENLPTKWEDCHVVAKGADFDALRDPATAALLPHGYDDSKPIEAWTIEDCRAAAAFRGGACLSEELKSPYDVLEWRTHEGKRFSARAYTVLKGGHWLPADEGEESWDYDLQAKHNPYYAAVWYDSHAREENTVYWFDKSGHAAYRIQEEQA